MCSVSWPTAAPRPQRRGWPVVAEFVDDDVSAYSGKTRPQYRAMLEAIREGEADAVLVWHMDRLHRRPIELEEFADVCTRAGVKDVVTLHGEFDLGTGDGLLVARLMAAVAANESDAKSRRTKRKQRELAERGLPSGGGDPAVRVHPGPAAPGRGRGRRHPHSRRSTPGR